MHYDLTMEESTLNRVSKKFIMNLCIFDKCVNFKIIYEFVLQY